MKACGIFSCLFTVALILIFPNHPLFAAKGTYVGEASNSVPAKNVLPVWDFRSGGIDGNLPIAYQAGQGEAVLGLAQKHKDKMLGVCHFFGHSDEFTPIAKLGIPVLEANEPGMKDVTQKQTWSPGQFKTSMVTWGYGHGMYTKQEMYFLWFDRLIRTRMPKGASTLKTVRDEDGWLGDVGTYNAFPYIAPFSEYKKDKSKAVWLPDAYFAYAWRAYMSTAPKGLIKLPVHQYRQNTTHSLNKPFPEGKPLTVLVDPETLPIRDMQAFAPGDGSLYKKASLAGGEKAQAKLTKVQLYSGNILLAEKTAPYWLFSNVHLPPGIHALLILTQYDDGSTYTSRVALLRVEGDMYKPAPTALTILEGASRPGAADYSNVFGILAGPGSLGSASAFNPHWTYGVGSDYRFRLDGKRSAPLRLE